MSRYPFLISVPHGGTAVPEAVAALVALSSDEIRYYSDPSTRLVYSFRDRVACYRDTDISRMIVDLNRPPYHLPPKHPDGVVKVRTVHGTPVFQGSIVPEITLIHQLLMTHYFPYHADLDRLLEPARIALALDCHSMLPEGPPTHRDAGRPRPMVCLGNNGDAEGNQRPGTLSTCPAGWITALAGAFREELGPGADVAINNPFSGGFITNAHYWHRGIPWIQVEVSRALYETGSADPVTASPDAGRARETGILVWNALSRFWDEIG
jgi:N-formylglutamate deformylase